MTSVDLNSDLGESFGAYVVGNDAAIIPLVSSVNIACGMHAGDPVVMHRTVRLAAEAGVAIGAHPGYPDLQGFGRRDLALSPDEGYSFVLYQIGALAAFCRTAGARLHHVKPHGQLYHRCAVETAFADAVAQAVHDADPSLVLVGLANSELIRAGRAIGLSTAEEFFADRNYTDEGTLVPRSLPNASIDDESLAVERAVRAACEGLVESVSGTTIAVRADTICVHGDSEHALAYVRAIRTALAEADCKIAPYPMQSRSLSSALS